MQRQEIVCVDLDGTLIAGDLFWECLLRLALIRPWVLLQVPLWALRGRAYLKRQVAVRVSLDASGLPYRPEVLEHLAQARARGSELVLATASDEIHAKEVSAHLGIFSRLVASDGQTNLKGKVKARRLEEEFGRGRFQYIGNDWADLPVWEAAGEVTVVAGSSRLISRLRGTFSLGANLGATPNRIRALVRALRPHQWAKNLLIFVPLVTSHRLADPANLVQGVLAFTAFCFTASAIYVVNDLFDIQSDRAHPRKRLRPFAAGHLSVPVGVLLSALLLSAGLLIGLLAASSAFLMVLILYIVTTTVYSAWAKRQPVLDVLMLASLYVLRVVAGGVATGIEISNWLLAFALFLFLSLAFVKRYTELLTQNGDMPGRGYQAVDGPWMLSIGTSAGYMAVVILALYVNSADVVALYSRPRVLWLLCAVLLHWIMRTWLRAGRRQIHDDPVVEALKDRASYVAALLGVLVLLAAI